jgi:hypothetical protein
MALKDGGTQTALIEDVLASFEGKFVLSEREHIEYFVKRYPFVVDFTLEAYSELRKVFPTETLFLEVNYDGDGSVYDVLVIKIGTTESVVEANQKLDKFLDNWWLSNMNNADSKLMIILGYL